MTLGERKNALPLQLFGLSNIGAQTYTYNGLGDRVRVDKPTGTRRFVYDSQGRVLAEYGGSAADVKAEFIWALPPGANDNGPFGGDDGVAGYAPLALVAQNAAGLPELYWVHGNHLGVPLVTTNAAGQVTNPGDDFLRPGFPGQAQVLTDLYYNRARDYDPVLGRYIQADPIGLMGGANPYLYAGADPVNMVDPLGLEYFDFLADTPEERALARKMLSEYNSLPQNIRDNRLYIFAHGNKTEVCSSRSGGCLNAKEFKELLEKKNKLTRGLPIWLWACNTGATDNGFAAGLAKETQATVWAPNALTWWGQSGMAGIHPRGGNPKAWYGTWQKWWQIGSMRRFPPK